MSQLRNQLKDITFDDITASNIQTVGGRVYADSSSRENVNDLVNVQKAWSAVHIPSKGQFIPQTSEVFQRSMDSGVVTTVMAPTGNQVQVMNQLNLTNSGEGTATITGTITDTNSELGPSMIIISESLTAGETVIIGREVKIDANATFSLVASAGGFDIGAYLHLVVQ